MSNKALRLFGEAFLRTLVIVLGIAIIVFAGFFIVKVVTGGGNTNDQSENSASTLDEDELQRQLDEENMTGEDETAETSTEDSEETVSDSTSLKIAVLNSTGTKGLAGAWVEKLQADGYTNIYAGNYKVGQLEASKIIAVTDGTGTDLVSYFSGATLETGTLTSGFNLTDETVTTTDIDLFIIIGTDDNIVAE